MIKNVCIFIMFIALVWLSLMVIQRPDNSSVELLQHNWIQQDKFGSDLPVPGYREGMIEMVSEQNLAKSATAKYPAWFRGTGEKSAYKEDSLYFYRAAVGPPSWVSTGLEANYFSTGTMTLKPNVSYPIHSHAAWEVYYVVEGEGEITKYDRTFTVKVGDFFMNRPFDVHSMKNTSNEVPFKVIWSWWAEGGEGLTFDKGGVALMSEECWRDSETACTSMPPPRLLKGSDRFEFMRHLEPIN